MNDSTDRHFVKYREKKTGGINIYEETDNRCFHLGLRWDGVC